MRKVACAMHGWYGPDGCPHCWVPEPPHAAAPVRVSTPDRSGDAATRKGAVAGAAASGDSRDSAESNGIWVDASVFAPDDSRTIGEVDWAKLATDLRTIADLRMTNEHLVHDNSWLRDDVRRLTRDIVLLRAKLKGRR